MRVLLCISVLAALATAFPCPQEIEDLSTPAAPLTDIFPASTTTIPDSTSLNIPVTAVPTIDPDDDDDDDKGAVVLNSTSSRRRPHTEPIPIFTKACKCNLATALYPCWATDALQRCHFEENFSYQCYMQAAGGCAYPTRICSSLYLPTPKPGPNPCQLLPRPPPPIITSLPLITALPTLNFTWPAVPTKMITLPALNTLL
ncbi:hypothetical protein L13192_06844 [Pyrenophora tritici-repentis]|nr:hypothetical protein L13192_06844 [Pyrenophora tritici-repentis]